MKAKFKQSKPYVKNQKYLRTMLLSIVSFICIPLILVQIYLIKQSMDKFEVSNVETYLSALKVNAESFESQTGLLSYNAIKIGMNSTVALPAMDDCSEYSIKASADTIKGYGIGLPLSANVGVYYRSSNIYLYNGVRKDFEALCDAFGVISSEKREALQKIMEYDNTTNYFGTDIGGAGNLLVTRAVSMRLSANYDSVIFFVIDVNDLLDIYLSNLPANTYFAICREDGQILLSSDQFPGQLWENQEFLRFCKLGTTDTYDGKINETSMQVYRYQASDGNIYLAAVEKNIAQAALRSYLYQAGATLLISCFALYVLLMLVVQINYRPIKQMVAKYAADDEGLMSEFERIDLAFSTQNQELSSQRNILTNIALGELIYGGDTDDKLLKKLFGKREHHAYAVTAVISSQITVTEAEFILEHIREKMPEVEVYTTSITGRPHILYIFMADDVNALAMIKMVTSRAVQSVTGMDFDVRIGTIVSRLKDIQSSYYAAITGAGAQNVATERNETYDAYPTQEIQHFLQFLVRGDADHAVQVLEEIEVKFEMQCISFPRRRFNYYKFLNAYLNVVQENLGPVSEQDFEQLLNFKNPMRAFELIKKSAVIYCDMVVGKEEDSDLERRMELISWVDEHITDLDLRLTTVAEALDMSPYAVSRLFKERIGEGFKEYVVRKRMEIGYELLRTTDASVTEIALQVGYENATYFSTTFKKQYGVPPSKLRFSKITGE